MAGMDMPMNHDMGMHTTFFWGKNVVMLFDDWPNGKLGMYILALAFVFVLAVATELFSALSAIKAGTNPVSGGLAHGLVRGLHMALAYLVMLSVMSYNLGVFISAVVGHGVGFFIVKSRAISRGSKP